MTVLADKPKTLPAPAAPSPIDMEAPEPFTREDFAQLAQTYRDLRMELTTEGELVIMPPATPETSSRNADLTADLVIWNRQHKAGKVFESSAGFTLPSGAETFSRMRPGSRMSRWEALTVQQREH